MTKSGEPPGSSPGKNPRKAQLDIGPCRRMQRRTYPFASVILSPGSKIGHTPRKNPHPLVGHKKCGNLPHQRISPAVMNGCSSHTVRSHKVVYHTFPCVASVFSAFFQIFLKKFCVLPKEEVLSLRRAPPPRPHASRRLWVPGVQEHNTASPALRQEDGLRHP